QKIVIKVDMHSDKCRTKALKIAAVEKGVVAVALEGDVKDKVVVIGEGIDVAGLTSRLRKKVNYASILSVQEVKPKKDVKEEIPTPYCWRPYNCPRPGEIYTVAYDPNPNTCIVL
ncbi:hypothetical protein Tsubulata_027963, partial [Turnera subulata]